MTSIGDQTPSVAISGVLDGSTSDWHTLYCSHLWSDSHLRREIINAPLTNSKVIKYCYTCKGKVRKYQVKSPLDERFKPNDHSTPKGKLSRKSVETPANDIQGNQIHDNSQVLNVNENTRVPNVNQCIPTISRQIDSSFRQKYISYEIRPDDRNQRRLRKSLKGIGCVINFALPDSPVKKRTQIQACSITVMIVAIVIISFILVNFTSPYFNRATEVAASTIVVPTQTNESDRTSPSTVTDGVIETKNVTTHILSTEFSTATVEITTEYRYTSLISHVISKIRKNIRTYPKDSKKMQESLKPKEITNRDLTKSFCSCQTYEVCMLDEITGTAICKTAVDAEDPTGCGGLCALETEACQLVDRARGVRVCRLVTLMTCAADQWRCRNGLCVPRGARCDGAVHCYDRSDEIHCDCDLTKEFRCGHSISCFPNTKICDGVIDCWDGFDEVNCTTACPESEFTCTDGQCIMSSRFCDGLADCGDGSDEPHGCGGCSIKEMQCANKRCIPATKRCDNNDDCGDSSDEINC